MSAFSETLVKLRKQDKLTQAQAADKIGITRSALSMYETDQREPDFETLEAIADFFNVDMNTLLGGSFGGRLPTNIIPMPRTNRVPRLGRIACGTPILAEENIEDYDDVPDYIKCDFTLVCRGDSMINARIFDGDIVCIKKDVEVHSGDIAAVLVDGDEATLKRVRIYEDHIVLEAENPTFPRKDFWDEDMNRIQIIGKATHFISAVR